MSAVRKWATVAATATLVVTSATPADAERWNRDDRIGDGPHGGDISRLTVANRETSVHVKVAFSDLIARKTGRDFFVVDTQRKDGSDYMVFTRWRKEGVRSRIIRTVPFSDSDAHRVVCTDLAVRWQPVKDRIVANVPQSCLRRPSPQIRAGFYSIDKDATDDDWAPGQFATYGPWLDRG